MGYTKPDPLYEKKTPSKGAGPSLYNGKKKENPDWDAIDSLGEGENPLSDAASRRETIQFCLLLSLAGFVFVGIWLYLEFPKVRGLGALPLVPLGYALYAALFGGKK